MKRNKTLFDLLLPEIIFHITSYLKKAEIKSFFFINYSIYSTFFKNEIRKNQIKLEPDFDLFIIKKIPIKDSFKKDIIIEKLSHEYFDNRVKKYRINYDLISTPLTLISTIFSLIFICVFAYIFFTHVCFLTGIAFVFIPLVLFIFTVLLEPIIKAYNKLVDNIFQKKKEVLEKNLIENLETLSVRERYNITQGNLPSFFPPKKTSTDETTLWETPSNKSLTYN